MNSDSIRQSPLLRPRVVTHPPITLPIPPEGEPQAPLEYTPVTGFRHCGSTSSDNTFVDPSDDSPAVDIDVNMDVVDPSENLPANDVDVNMDPVDPSNNLSADGVGVNTDHSSRSGRTTTYLVPPTITYGKQPNTLERMDADEHSSKRMGNTFFPFASKEEWDLAKFLSETLTQTEIDRFLKLRWTKNNFLSEAFRSALKLRDCIDSLPGGPQWRIEELSIDGYDTVAPIKLLWRDGLEALIHLFGNPVFAHHMSFDGKVETVLRQPGGEPEIELSEFSTGKHFAALHAAYTTSIPGATIVGVILASDKTHVTTGTGGLHMHPVFLTISNIVSTVRQKATSHAWICVGFLPIPVFTVHSETQSILAARLWHRCMDIITATLKEAARIGALAADPLGDVRKIVTPLVIHTGDLPEQQLGAGVSRNSSPVSIATLKSFGDAQGSPPRLGIHTLQTIAKLCQEIDPWRLTEFVGAAKAVGLSGVNLPFWRDWTYSDPSLFLAPELLHTLHKFFFDHPLVWCKAVLGAEELDCRFRCLHKRIGYRHFAGGITHVNQMTGREHRDIQRTIVAVIAGAVSGGFLRAIRALIDFIYIAQYPSHTATTINMLTQALEKFHKNKHHILEAGARAGKAGPMEHFNIPKLELFHSFARAIEFLGALQQYTADVSERLLIVTCKHPFKHTNHKGNWDEQCAHILDRQERIRLFDLYTLLRDSNQSLLNDVVAEEDSAITNTLIDSHPEAAWLARVVAPEETRFRGPRLGRNLFATEGCIILDSTTAVLLNVSPHATLSIDDAAAEFKLEDLHTALLDYRNTVQPGLSNRDLGFDRIKVWYKFRIQMCSVHHQDIIMPAETVQAFPPSATAPYGTCDTVLVKNTYSKSLDIDAFDVVQVRLVFQAVPRAKATLPEYLNCPLTYVQYFDYASRRNDKNFLVQEPDVEMHLLRRRRWATKKPVGSIISLIDIARPIEIIPVYGEKCALDLSSDNSLDIWEIFYLNNFSDKEVYAKLLNEYDGISGMM